MLSGMDARLRHRLPLAGAAVYVWHCDAAGVYSGFQGQLGGLDTRGYRVILAPPPHGVIAMAREKIQSYVKRKILGGEFAQNLVLIGTKS